MPHSSTLASVQIDVEEEPHELPHPDPDAPFRLLIAGDFSGGASRIRKPVAVDRDNFDEVLALFAPALRLDFAKTQLPIEFHELDDFHPDRLFERLGPFQALRDLRERVEAGAVMPSASQSQNLSGADVLGAMMGDQPASTATAKARSTWDHMLHEMVAPYAEKKPDPRRPAWIAQIDAAVAGEMRGVLHHREYQDLESAWRGLFFLVRRLETGEDLKVHVWDMPQSTLATAEGVAALRRVAVEEATGTPGATPWTVIAGLYSFGPQEEPVLAQIASIARSAGAPFLAGVAPDVVGLTKVFDDLRHSPGARWVGLALPRFLLRLPYGAKTDSTERFAFEEMPTPTEHERYLWGNPSILCASLLGEAFSRYGWRMRPGMVSQVEGLPAHVYKSDGEPELKPCAEVLLTEDAVELLMSRGLMPLVSMKGSDRVRVARFQSVAEPAAPLAGRWEQQ